MSAALFGSNKKINNAAIVGGNALMIVTTGNIHTLPLTSGSATSASLKRKASGEANEEAKRRKGAEMPKPSLKRRADGSIKRSVKRMREDARYSAGSEEVKRLALPGLSDTEKIRMGLEGPGGLYFVTQGAISVAEGGVVRRLALPGFTGTGDRGHNHRIGFLPNKNLVVVVDMANELVVTEYEGEVLQNRQSYPRPDMYGERKTCVYVYESIVIVADHFYNRLVIVDARGMSAETVMERLSIVDEVVASVVVIGGDIFHVTNIRVFDTPLLYKNGRPFCVLPDSANQLLPHPGGGILAVTDKLIVHLGAKWAPEIYRSLVPELMRMVKAIFLLRRRSGCQWGRLPLDMIHNILAWNM